LTHEVSFGEMTAVLLEVASHAAAQARFKTNNQKWVHSLGGRVDWTRAEIIKMIAHKNRRVTENGTIGSSQIQYMMKTYIFLAPHVFFGHGCVTPRAVSGCSTSTLGILVP